MHKPAFVGINVEPSMFNSSTRTRQHWLYLWAYNNLFIPPKLHPLSKQNGLRVSFAFPFNPSRRAPRPMGLPGLLHHHLLRQPSAAGHRSTLEPFGRASG